MDKGARLAAEINQGRGRNKKEKNEKKKENRSKQ
jgi:hypothetical protein